MTLATGAVALETTRVVKKLLPKQAGTQRWQQTYGDQLVCVRYRQDPSGLRRLVTVELLVDERAARPRHPTPETQPPSRAEASPPSKAAEAVWVLIRYGEADLAAKAKAHGARWHPQARLWRMTRQQAEQAGLTDRIQAAE